MKAAVGALLVAGHVAGYLAVARHRPAELAVVLPPPGAADPLAGAPSIAARVDDDDGTPPGPGLHRRRWSVTYRGGFTRSVGAAALVGPFQDPAAPPCAGRVLVGTRLLDDGHAGEGTLAATLAAAIDAELAGQELLGVVRYVRTRDVALAWRGPAGHPEDAALLGEAGAPHGYVRARATIELDRLSVEVVVALVSEAPAAAGPPAFRVAARAHLDFDSRILQWLGDRLGADRLASRLARRQLDHLLDTTLAPPPPLALPGGGALRFRYCAAPLELGDDGAALPFAVELDAARGPGRVLPPRRGPGPRRPIAASTAVALDLDLDALDALLFDLWRAGELDRQLAEAGLERRFNEDPTVAALLTLRLGPPRLALPPALGVTARGLRLSAAATVAISDGDGATTGRVWGGLDLAFAPSARGAAVGVAVDLGALELSCEAAPSTLVPCYADLVEALRGRAGELHGELSAALARLLTALFVERRVGADGLPAELVVHGVQPRLWTAGANATLRLELDATLAPPR